MKKTILIFGISSFVGSNLAEALGKDYRIVGTYFENPIKIPGVFTLKCDVHKKDQVSNIVGFLKPNITIYAVGLSSVWACHQNPKLSDALNSAGVGNVASASERVRAQFIYLSSAYALAGDDVLYKEGDTPFPVTVYGGSLAQSEYYIQKSCLNYLILRCGRLYGKSLSLVHHNWFETVHEKVVKSEVLNVDDSLKIGFMDIQLLALYIKSFIEKEISNRLVHVTSKDVMTYYQFTAKMLEIFKLDKSLLQSQPWSFPIDQKQLKLVKLQEQYNFHLDCTNAEILLGQSMPTIEESLQFSLKNVSKRS
jgi:dTDP-4-dehydrorhamnose reductase